MKRSFWKTFLVVALLATAGCGDRSRQDAAAYQQGIDAYAKGDFAVALKKLQPIAEQGNADAQFRLGLMYDLGNGVAQDDKQAVAWWSKAAEQGQAEAQEHLGLNYAKGKGVERDWVQADKWFGIAAASGKESAIKNQKVVEVHMQPDKIAEANALVQEWLAKRKK
ncbi:MAG: sel1 repeat family protein [Pseudomonadota bacterium]